MIDLNIPYKKYNNTFIEQCACSPKDPVEVFYQHAQKNNKYAYLKRARESYRFRQDPVPYTGKRCGGPAWSSPHTQV